MGQRLRSWWDRNLKEAPNEDALLATQNMMLAAHSMGLGTCLIGFAVIPLIKDIRAKRILGIPDSEHVHAVIALGYTDERYIGMAGRKKTISRYSEAAQTRN
jgi:nitroreductase